MNNKVGVKEGASAVCITMLPSLIYDFMGKGIDKFLAGYLINFSLVSLLVFIMLILFKRIIFFIKENKSVWINKVLNIVFFAFAIVFTIYNLYIGINAVHSLLEQKFDFEIILLLHVIPACICACCGIESVSRTCLVMLGFISIIIILMCVISFKGWTFVNFMPIFGKNIKSTLFNFEQIGTFCGMLTSIYILNFFECPKKAYLSVKRSFKLFLFLALAMIVMCIFSIPYPVGDLYPFTFSAIFAVAKSGGFVHRFETLMVVFMLIVNIMSLSFNLFIIADYFAKLTKTKEYKPFVKILTLIFSLFILITSNQIIGLNVVLYSAFICVLFWGLIIIYKRVVERKP